MKNSGSNWDRILGSPWAGVYLNELYWLARDTSEQCQQLFIDAPQPPPESSYIKVDHKLHRDVYRILNNAARIAALIKNRNRRSDQSAGQYEVQHRRARWLREVLSGLHIEELLHSKVRHSLEHFDEFIDKTALRSSRDQITTPTLFPIDMTLGREDTLHQFLKNGLEGGSVYPLRVYLAEERTFVNCERRIDVAKMAREADAIHGHIEEVAPHVIQREEKLSSDKRGSSMLVITDKTYGSTHGASG